jgi:hypothetical protein
MLRFRGTEQLDDLAARLRDAPRRLRSELRSELAAAARPVQRAVKDEIERAPMGQRRMWTPKTTRTVGKRLGRGSSPLRAPIARAVQVKAEVTGDGAYAELQLREEQVSPTKRWLIPYLVGRRKRLRHPFMGRWRHAVQATGNLDVWWRTIQRHLPAFTRARDTAVRRVEDHLEG